MAGKPYKVQPLKTQWKFKGYDKPAPIANDYLRFNRIVGGIRMRQAVSSANYKDCRFPTGFDRDVAEKWFGRPCLPSQSIPDLTPEIPETESLDSPARVQWLLPEVEVDPLAVACGTVVDMEDGCSQMDAKALTLETCRCEWCRKQSPRQPWIDQQTERVEISFVSYNPQYGLYSYASVNFFFNRGGHIHKFVNIMSAFADPLTAPLVELIPMITADAIWLGSLSYVLLSELKEVVTVVRSSKERCYRSIAFDYLGLWNMVDWVSICVAIFVVLMFVRFRLSVGHVNEQLVPMIDLSLQASKINEAPGYQKASGCSGLSVASMIAGTSADGLADRYKEASVSFFSVVEDMCQTERVFRLSLCIYPMVVMLRLFKSFSAQPRLALVTSTISKASQDILHFFIVFGSVYFCMIVNSMLFFGQDVEEFATLDRAFLTCFRAMFGDWDWAAMRQVGRAKAAIWFWLFMVVMVVILLNMLIAILMEAYSAVKQKNGDAATLAQQMQTIWRRFRQTKAGERVRLNEVWTHFMKEHGNDAKTVLESERPITPDYLIENVPGMKFAQAKRTLGESLKSHNEELEAQKAEGINVNDEIKRLIESVSDRSETIQGELQWCKGRLEYYDSVEVPGDPEFDYYFRDEGDTNGSLTNAVSSTVTELSTEMAEVLSSEMLKLQRRQEVLETQQFEMHGMLNDMQVLVAREVRVMAEISEAADYFNPFDSAVERRSAGSGGNARLPVVGLD